MVGVPTLIGMGQNRRRRLAPQAFGHSSGEPGELEIGVLVGDAEGGGRTAPASPAISAAPSSRRRAAA